MSIFQDKLEDELLFASAAAAAALAMEPFLSVTVFFPGLIVSINMFSLLWGVSECRTTTAAKTKSCESERKRSLCQIACAVTFGLAADVQIKSFPDMTTEDDCI